jgi:hypothetical protein
MSDRRGWWILVEGPKDFRGDPRSHLLQMLPVDGGRDQAVAQAAEVARTCVPDVHSVREPKTYERRVFRTAETGWLVELALKDWPDSYSFPTTWTALIRISIAELEYEHKTPAPERPVKKGRFRR